MLVRKWVHSSTGSVTIGRDAVIQYAVAIVTTVLVLGSLVPILYQSLVDRPLYDAGKTLTLSNYLRLLRSPDFHKVVLDTLVFAILTTLIAVGIGTILAVLIGRTDVPGSRFFDEMILWPLYLSPLVVAFAWVITYGPSGYVTTWIQQVIGRVPWNLYTVPGMALAAAVAQAPLAYLYARSSVVVMDSSLEDAARIAGAGPLRSFFAITLPLMRPPVLYSTVLVFTASLELLSIPLILGNPVGIDLFASFLYNKGFLSTQPDYGLLAAATVVLLLFLAVLVAVQTHLLGNTYRFVSVRGKATRPRTLRLGWFRWPALLVVVGYLVVGGILPIAGLTLRAVTAVLTPMVSPLEMLTANNFRVIFSYPVFVRSITNSMLIAVIGGVIATVFTVLVALVSHRSSFRFRRGLEFVALAPRSLPGIVIGMGFFWAFVVLPLGWLRNTILALLVAFMVRYLPSSFGAIVPMLMRFGSELDQAARIMGADWWTTSSKIVLRLLRPAMFSSFVLLSVQFLREYSSAVFLYAPGSEIMGVTMLQFWIQGDTGPVAAMAVIQIFVTVIMVSIARKVGGVRIYAGAGR